MRWNESRHLLGVALGLVGSAALAGAQPVVDFDASRNTPCGDYPLALVSGDFNEDGLPDLATASLWGGDCQLPGSISILDAKVAGFFPARQIHAEMNNYPDDLATGDFDEDGHLDLVSINVGTNGLPDAEDCTVDGSIALFTGDGRGQLTLHLLMDDPAGTPLAVAAGDFDADGHLDIAVAYQQRYVRLFRGDGAGGLSARSIINVGNTPTRMVAADFDRDGRLDVAVAVETPLFEGLVAILGGDGAGGFTLVRNLPVAKRPSSIVTADLDGDGRPDIATTSLILNEVSVLRNLSSGFLPAANYAVGIAPTGLAAADLDGDGNLDLAAANSVSSDVSLLLGDGHGAFAPATSLVVEGTPDAILALDVDRDGRIDLVMTNDFGAISVLNGEGSGAFVVNRSFTAGYFPSAIAIADFNNDGREDVASPNELSDDVSVLLGDGTGGLLPQQRFAVGKNPIDVASADFDEDGNLDLGIADLTGGGITILAGNGAGGFTRSLDFAAGGTATRIIAADFDRDGHADLAVADSASKAVIVFKGDGAGAFGAPRTIALGDDPRAIAAADLDGDGVLDLAVALFDLAPYTSHRVTILKGDGTGGFTALPGDVPLPAYPVALVAGDLDGDGALDLAVIAGENLVSLFAGDGSGGFAAAGTLGADVLNTATALVIVDLDEDGRADVAVANAFGASVFRSQEGGGFAPASSFGPQGSRSIAAADIDGDGHVDLVLGNPYGNDVTVLSNRTLDLFACRAGNVNAGAGPVTPVLLVNGSSGVGPGRRIVIDRHAPFELRMDAPPSNPGGPSGFALYAWLKRAPTRFTRTDLRFRVGTACMPLLLRPAPPFRPDAVWNNLGNHAILGVPTLPSAAAPSVVLSRAKGLGSPVSFFLQGLIVDSSAPNGRAAITNGIEIESR